MCVNENNLMVFEMKEERIEKFIEKLIKKTEKKKITWKVLNKIDDWKNIKEEIKVIKQEDLKNYFIEENKSYCIVKAGGYVILLRMRYGNASIFSPVLDRYVLLVKINEELYTVNLADYAIDGYDEMIEKLYEIIEQQKRNKYNITDCLNEFLEKI